MLHTILTEHSTGLGEGGRLQKVSRYAARGLLYNARGHIALLHMPGNGCCKLPGGGLEAGETPRRAFCREVLEETGYTCSEPVYLGVVEEHKARSAFYQYSHVFCAHTLGDPQPLRLTPAEQAAGMRLLWLAPTEALAVTRRNLQACREYSLRFMLLRELAILEAGDARRRHT